MNEVLNFLSENQTFFLATVEGDQPHVRPFGAVCEFEGNLYLCTSNKKPVFEQIKTNSKVEICGMGKKGDWLRVEAKAIQDYRVEAREAMLEANPGLKNMYSVDDGKFEVIRLQDATAIFSSFSDAPKTVTF